MGMLRDKKTQLRMAVDDAVRAYLDHVADQAGDPDAFVDAETEQVLDEVDRASVRIEKG